MPYKIGMVSLGCPKNQVDAEIILRKLADAGFAITPQEQEADVIIVNTCGFIEEAKKEAIENILEAAQYKQHGKLKSLIVTGCLAERYRDEITKEIPEVDVVVGIGKNSDIVKIVKESLSGKNENYYGEKTDLNIEGARILTTQPFWAYLKIAEGCDNRCSYCAIPAIRGPYRSRSMESILSEAADLAQTGVKELILVAQDTTRYGEDLYGKIMLPGLLKALAQIEGIHWIRMLYTYPDRITDELLDVMVGVPKVVPYLDIPLQHCNREILRRMNRRGDRVQLEALIHKIRTHVPGVTIRTTLIAGFPGETEQQFEELCEFVKSQRFDRLGCFAYSAEENTPAAEFGNQIDPQVKQNRMDIIMSEQLTIVHEKNKSRIGSTTEVLVEGYDSYIKCYFGRSAAEAPEIDGKIFFTSPRPLEIGGFVNVLINDTLDYDLLGELAE